MRYLSLIGVALMGLSGCIGAGSVTALEQPAPGYMPRMSGIDLLGEDRRIPESLQGDLNIVTFAFEREQQEQVNTWINMLDNLLQENPDIRYYEIPLIYEMSALGRSWVNNGMRSGIPSEKARERTITVYTDREKFFEMMNMSKDYIYTLLVDDAGKIYWRAQGVANDMHLKDLNEAIADAQKE